ncbi:MAG: EAL domain-containing protein [Bacilli bacterium]|nr:EAL domain-containing protein [Bacilli bacterium]
MKNKEKHIRFMLYFITVATGILFLGAIGIFLVILFKPESLSSKALAGIYLGLVFGAAGLIALISFYVAKLSKIRIQIDNSNEYFLEPHFIYSETELTKEMDRLYRRKKVGLFASFGIKDLQSDILATYGSNIVKQLNEMTFQTVCDYCQHHHSVIFGYSILDDFMLYKSDNDLETFIKDLVALRESIYQKIETIQNLPTVLIQIGVYERKIIHESSSDVVKNAVYARKNNPEGKLGEDIVIFNEKLVGSGSEGEAVQELRRALAEEQFEIYYQAKFNLKTNRFTGAEALIRWIHPTRGLLPPTSFIPIAEQNGMITEIDRYVFTHVCRDISKWERERKRLVKISVNLSRGSVFDTDIISFFQEVMKENKVNPLLLEIEITESMAAKNPNFVSAFIKKLNEAGFSTSIDDFGVGYSSFSSLKKLPFNVLKIDKSFIDDIEFDKKSRDIVRSVISVGHALEMEVIAEGVQSSKQMEILRKMELDLIQGFYYSRALPCREFEKFLSNNSFENKGDN